MDPAAFITLVQQCAPGAPAEPLAAIVRRASDFEPLAIRTVTTNSVAIQATSTAEAVQLTSELVIAGHQVRIGLAQIDTRDLTRIGLSLADGFEPCAHVKAAARLLSEDPSRLRPSSSPARRRVPAEVVGQGVRSDEPRLTRDKPAAPPWDVYGQGRGSSVLVYSGPR